MRMASKGHSDRHRLHPVQVPMTGSGRAMSPVIRIANSGQTSRQMPHPVHESGFRCHCQLMMDLRCPDWFLFGVAPGKSPMQIRPVAPGTK